MNKRRFILVASVCAFGVLGLAPSAFAEATRTWVSGVGDDANPCSRTAPCKTWAGAISKTASGGEIDALDPGGFGTVTITKSITINGRGTHASILSAGTVGINISDASTAAPGTIKVKLRNISINGAGTGTAGIRFISGKSLVVDNVDVFNMLNTGLTIFPTSGTTTVNVRNSSFDDLGQAGIAGAPSGTGKVRMSVVNTELDGDQWGISSGAGSKISATRCDASENATAGLFVHDGGVLNVTDCLVSGNTNAGGNASGLLAQTSGIMRVSNSTITDNDLGLSFLSGGQLLSRLNNTVEGNGIDGTFSGTYGSK